MLIFLFLLLFAALCVLGFYYFSSKIEAHKRQALLLAKQNNELRKKVLEANRGTVNLTIRYLTPSYKKVTARTHCTLYFYPLPTAPELSKIISNTVLEVHDSADVSGTLWYEVSMPGLERINNKGWVKESDIMLP